MAIFKDNVNVYDETWHSSEWKPYYNKPTSRLLMSDSGESVEITVWCAEEEWEGTDFSLIVKGDNSVRQDYLKTIEYEIGDTSVSQTEHGEAIGKAGYAVNHSTHHNDRNVKWWYGPGVGMQFDDGVHTTGDYTSAETIYLHNITSSDIGEKVYDGGLHCWMKLPGRPLGDAEATALNSVIYSKNVPMEYIGNNDFLMVFNSFAHGVIKREGEVGNTALSLTWQYSPILNAGAAKDFIDDEVNIMDDVDIEAISTPMNENHQLAAVIGTVSPLTGRQKANSLRFYWRTEDGAGAEAILHNGQFIRISLYPINGS